MCIRDSYNAGQDCTAACRIYAGKKVYDRLVADLSAAVSTITLSQADDTTNEIGPLISLRQRDRVASFVNRARELPHIEVTTGGEVMADGFYYRPTVVAGARQDDEIVRREVFGPVSYTHLDVYKRQAGPCPPGCLWQPQTLSLIHIFSVKRLNIAPKIPPVTPQAITRGQSPGKLAVSRATPK